MPLFHRHSATPATTNNNVLLQQNTMAGVPLQPGMPIVGQQTIVAQPISAPQTFLAQPGGFAQTQTMVYQPAGGPLVAQAPLLQQQQNVFLTKEVVSTTGLTTQMSSTSLVGGKQTIVKPAIIAETIRTDTLVQVQPIVHREIDQQRVHHVEQHITERAAPAMGGTVRLAPVVQQTVRTNVIEEVQPVIHREVATRSIERVEEHLTERIAAPAIHTHEVQTNTTVLNAGAPLLTQGAALPLTQGTPILTQGTVLPLTQGATLPLQQPLTQGAALPLNQQGVLLNNNNNLTSEALLKEKALLNKHHNNQQPTLQKSYVPAGGSAANLARPL